MRDKRSIFLNTVAQVVVRVLGLGIAIASTRLITNYLGQAGTGQYNTINTYLGFCVVLADFGLFSTAVREISRKPEDEAKILTNVFWVRLVTALIASAVGGLAILFFPYQIEVKLGSLVALGFVFFNLMASVYDIILQYRLKMQFSALAELVSKMITLGALFWIIRHHGSFYEVAGTISLSGALIFLFKWILGQHYAPLKWTHYDATFSQWILRLALPLGIVYVLNNIFFKIDGLLVYSLKGDSAAGVYSVAYKVLEVTLFIGSYFASALKPSLSRTVVQEPKEAASILNKGVTIMLFLAMPIAMLSVVFSKEIILFLSNSQFLAGAGALQVLGITLPFLYLDMLFGEILIAVNARLLLVRIAVVMLITNLIFNVIFIPLYSYHAAAVITLGSEVLLCFINWYYIRTFVPYTFDAVAALKILAVTLISGGVGWELGSMLHPSGSGTLRLIILIIISLLVYVGASFAAGIMKPSQLKNILRSES